MLFPLLWWMHTRPGLNCPLPGTIGMMSISKQLLTGHDNMGFLGLCRDIKRVMRRSKTWATKQFMGG